ncbi:hypothetical protein NDU88_006161 [Pleurodeles waltl]|uniref:Uncharacterized protein n=1 Tax=Pleurodeles waltl TaxID=8319 RepID=A0AAV7UM04_PLEWA|nr:hypothetical protein NDU88_006161 [Pleurodeles waltl]
MGGGNPVKEDAHRIGQWFFNPPIEGHRAGLTKGGTRCVSCLLVAWTVPLEETVVGTVFPNLVLSRTNRLEESAPALELKEEGDPPRAKQRSPQEPDRVPA